MYGFLNLLDKVKKYFAFSKEEIKSLVFAILILGFVVGFDDGRETFEMLYWLHNLLNSLLIVGLAVIVREVGHRVYALQSGHRAELKIWWFGILASLIISIVSLGQIKILIYGGLLIHFMEKHRIGYFRHWQGNYDMSIIALSGSVANLMLAFFFKLFMFLPNNALIEKAILINVVMASVNMLPIPPLDGSMIFFASREIYVFTLGLVLGASVLLYFAPLLVALIGSVLIGLLFIFAYNILFERQSGK